MNLDVDVGNTRVKWRLSHSDGVEYGAFARGEEPVFPDTPPHQVRVSSVAGSDYERSLSALIDETWGLQPWFART